MNHIEAALSQARILLQGGEQAQAKAILIPIVRSPGPVSGEAWWLLAQTLDDPGQQADCYARAAAAGYQPPTAEPPLEEPPLLMPWELPDALPGLTPISGPADRPQALAQPSNPPPAAPSQPEPRFGQQQFDHDDRAFVIKSLGRGIDRYAIVQQVMLRADCVHSDADRFVREIESHSQGQVGRRQLPVMLLIGAVGMVGGVLVAFIGLLMLLGAVRIPFIGFMFFGFGHVVFALIGIVMGVAAAWRGVLSILRGLRNAAK